VKITLYYCVLVEIWWATWGEDDSPQQVRCVAATTVVDMSTTDKYDMGTTWNTQETQRDKGRKLQRMLAS